MSKNAASDTTDSLPEPSQIFPAGPPVVEKKETLFLGSHFEGLGDAWEVLLGEFSEEMEEGDELSLREKLFYHICAQTLDKGVLDPSCLVLYQANNMRVALVQSDPRKSVQAGVLIRGDDADSNHILVNGYPILQGLPNSMDILEAHTWSNGVEGEVLARMAGSATTPVSFFAPFYFRDFAQFEEDRRCTIFLAALALSISQAKQKSVIIDEGEFYEMELKQFLAKNTGKTAADFSGPEIILEGARMLFPSDTASCQEFRVPVLEVRYCMFFDIDLFRIRTEFVLDHVDGNDVALQGYIYAPLHLLEGYMPQVGDDIEGFLWMTGYLG